MIWTKFLLLSNPLSLSTHIEGGRRKGKHDTRFFFPLLRIEVLLFKNWNRIFKTRLPPSFLSLSPTQPKSFYLWENRPFAKRTLTFRGGHRDLLFLWVVWGLHRTLRLVRVRLSGSAGLLRGRGHRVTRGRCCCCCCCCRRRCCCCCCGVTSSGRGQSVYSDGGGHLEREKKIESWHASLRWRTTEAEADGGPASLKKRGNFYFPLLKICFSADFPHTDPEENSPPSSPSPPPPPPIYGISFPAHSGGGKIFGTVSEFSY